MNGAGVCKSLKKSFAASGYEQPLRVDEEGLRRRNIHGEEGSGIQAADERVACGLNLVRHSNRELCRGVCGKNRAFYQILLR